MFYLDTIVYIYTPNWCIIIQNYTPNIFLDYHPEVMVYLRNNGFISDYDNRVCKYFIGNKECTKKSKTYQIKILKIPK